MNRQNFTYSFESPKTPEEIFELLQDIHQWWSGFYGETIEGKSEQVNDEFSFTAGGGMHYSKQRVTDLVQNKRITWEVTDSKLTFLADTDEWTGSHFSFDLSEQNGKTVVTFTHDGLTPELECYDQCSNGWTSYLGALKNKLS